MNSSIDARMSLYTKGLNDCQIASCTGTNKTAIRKWRQLNGLPPNALSSARAKHDGTLQQRLDLYNAGLDDVEIARIQHISRSAVAHWRHRNNLPNGSKESREAKQDLYPVRKFLYDLNWGDDSIAWQQGVIRNSILKWRVTHGLPANRPSQMTRKRDKLRSLHQLQRRIFRAIDRSLPDDIADDAAAELLLAVINGDIAVQDIEKAGRRYGNKALREYADAFKSRSLDEEIPGSEGLRPIDMLIDDSSRDWLEEMGASWH